MQMQLWKLNATFFPRQIHEIIGGTCEIVFLRDVSQGRFDIRKYHENTEQCWNYAKRLYSLKYLGLFNQRRKNSRRGEYRLSVSYNQLSVCINVHMRILCSFTYGCVRRRAVVDIRGYRTEQRRTDIFPFQLEFAIRRIFLVFHHLLIGFALRLDSAHCDSGTAKSSSKYLLTKYRKYSRNLSDTYISSQSKMH